MSSPVVSDFAFRPGLRLRTAREQAGLSREAVSVQLHIGEAMVAALEEDQYEDLPEPVFIRGYMRRYADLVGLPPDEIAECFDNFYQADTGRSSRTGLRPNPLRVLGDIDSAAVARRLARREREPRPWGRWLLILSGLTLVALVAIALAPALSARLSGQPGQAASAPVTEQALPGAVTVAAASDVLVIELQADCLVMVRDAEERELASGMHKAGERLRMEGVSPFRIELNPAGAVRLRLNDQPVDLGPYTVNDIVNFRLSR